ncbi:MAG: sigma-54 dependent transcriptional regulator [Planctomycetota bacterium]
MERDIKVLIIDDEANHARATAEIAERMGYDVAVATSGRNGLKTLEADRFDIVVTDVVMGETSGLDILARAKEIDDQCEVILVSGEGSVESAVEAMRYGAASYLMKPLKVDEFRQQLRDAVRRVRDRRNGAAEEPLRVVAERVHEDEDGDFPEFIGNSAALTRVFDTIRKVAPTPATVLVTGANGTGKELVARALHRLSPRAKNPFVALNCGAMAENILESELFGHVRGAFTGATQNREGHFEHADKGTLFLDEIGDTSLSFQVKLLRVLQEKEVTPIGGSHAKRVDVRIIAATNRNLDEEVKRGNFREDLLYRLKVVHIAMPPLKERREDIPALVAHFVADANELFGRGVRGVEPTAMQQLINYDWPGNIRQLKNVVEQMVVLTESDRLGPADIPPEVTGTTSRSQALAPLEIFESLSLSGIEEFMIRHHLKRFDGNRARVAEALGISERTLYRKLKEYGISAPTPGAK